jgi:hypothetical protein
LDAESTQILEGSDRIEGQGGELLLVLEEIIIPFGRVGSDSKLLIFFLRMFLPRYGIWVS